MTLCVCVCLCAGDKKKAALTLACSAICRTNSGRFRSETILATVVSTSPSRSGEERRIVRGEEEKEGRVGGGGGGGRQG